MLNTPNKKLVFQIGDRVFVPAQGLMEVTGTETESYGGVDIQMYVLQNHHSKHLVPVVKATENGIVHPGNENTITSIIATLKGKKRNQSGSWKQRKKILDGQINGSDLLQIAATIRDLHCEPEADGSGGMGNVSYSKKQLYDQALTLLLPVVALIKKITPSEALEYLTEASGLNLDFDTSRIQTELTPKKTPVHQTASQATYVKELLDRPGAESHTSPTEPMADKGAKARDCKQSDRLLQVIEALKSEDAKKQQTIDMYRKKAEETKQEQAQIDTQIGALQQQITDLCDQLDRKSIRLQQLRSNLQAASSQIATLSTELSELINQHDSALDTLRSVKKNVVTATSGLPATELTPEAPAATQMSPKHTPSERAAAAALMAKRGYKQGKDGFWIPAK